MKRDLRQRGDPYIGWGIGLAVVLFLMYVYPGFMTPLTAHFDGSCKALPLQASAEDLRIDPANGLVYLTYYDSVDTRRPERAPPGPSPTGTIMLVDLNAAEPHVRAALASEPADFKPSGLSLYTKPDGTKRLFVTSRNQLGKHSVEIFDQAATGAFTHVETIRDSKLWSPTAIVAVGPRQFYVVNQLGFKRYGDDWEIQTRERLRGNQGSVAYYDGEQMKIVATDLGLPVGIAISADGRTVYVSQASRNIIQKFDRDVSSGALMQKDWIRIPGSPRNLTVDSDGTLWVSSRPHSVSFSGWFEDGVNRAPTQVFKVTPTADPGKQVQELYLNDDGQELSDGSVAAPRGNGRFVLGSRTDHKLLMCTQSGATKPADPAAKTTTS